MVALLAVFFLLLMWHPCGLTFWCECYGLYLRHEPVELAHSFYSALVSVSVFMALSIVSHLINSPDNSLLSQSVFLVLFLPCWSLRAHLHVVGMLQLLFLT